MKTSLFWYPLPERLIAQHPVEERGTEKMMVLHRATGVLEHRHIKDFVDYIEPNDLLVVNDTKVFPARLIGEWPDTHGQVEILLVSPAPGISAESSEHTVVWNCIVGSGRKCREGQVASFGNAGELKAKLISPLEGIGMWKIEFSCAKPLMELLDEIGHTPVPPYVKREGTSEEEKADRERYQTIYARHVGSVAAPTAGLHFTPEIFASLEEKGVKRVSITLHVGPGTFRPVKAQNIEDHHMDFEAFTISPETADEINACKARGGRVFCCGSTTVRTLETVAAANDGKIVAGSGASNIFIYPPFEFKVTDAMLTNFHLPQSTLLMMISALAGRERVLCSYAMAVKANYRFFSYGDCMLIV
ncbi:MAG: tRNA preQ1(34) S-adenosylmethionine ribosyltransferase-isomerase QueA [Kiritimatiellae bacterium]|nr:tRNA preQ1(34) S-adenosylmethionine ribosyltransferase-isomerase QueA [Kiritimatiellia bacterium]